MSASKPNNPTKPSKSKPQKPIDPRELSEHLMTLSPRFEVPRGSAVERARSALEQFQGLQDLIDESVQESAQHVAHPSTAVAAGASSDAGSIPFVEGFQREAIPGQLAKQSPAPRPPRRDIAYRATNPAHQGALANREIVDALLALHPRAQKPTAHASHASSASPGDLEPTRVPRVDTEASMVVFSRRSRARDEGLTAVLKPKKKSPSV